MNLIPFGEVERERYDISKKYGLIEVVNGIWRLTLKCKSNYDPSSYVRYLRGELEKPLRITESKIEKKQTPQEELKTEPVQQLINDILAM